MTVKETAKLLGVSRQSIYKRLSSDSRFVDSVEYITTDEKGRKHISKTGVQLLRESFQVDKLDNPVDSQVDNSVDCQPTVNQAVNSLVNQLTAKDKLIEEQQQTIRELTAALNNTTESMKAAQALHVSTIKTQLEMHKPSLITRLQKWFRQE